MTCQVLRSNPMTPPWFYLWPTRFTLMKNIFFLVNLTRLGCCWCLSFNHTTGKATLIKMVALDFNAHNCINKYNSHVFIFTISKFLLFYPWMCVIIPVASGTWVDLYNIPHPLWTDSLSLRPRDPPTSVSQRALPFLRWNHSQVY